MRFPDNLVVVARHRTTGAPVTNVAIVLMFLAVNKNNYCVGPLIADERGQVQITRADCEAAIKRAQGMFVMDYSDSLESCRPLIEVLLQPPAQVQTMLQQYTQFPGFWSRDFVTPTQLFADLETVENADYESARITATEEELRSHTQLELLLVRRAVEKIPQPIAAKVDQ